MERKNLKAMQAYYDRKASMFFWTPDGVGGYWYDTKAEMEAQHGPTPVGGVIHVSEILDY